MEIRSKCEDGVISKRARNSTNLTQVLFKSCLIIRPPMNMGTPKQVTMALTIQFYPLASQHGGNVSHHCGCANTTAGVSVSILHMLSLETD